MTMNVQASKEAQLLEEVKEYYGRILSTQADLKTSACTASAQMPPHLRAALARIPEEIMEKFYGCGNPIPDGIQGLTVLDLGCGSGRDCYVAAQWVGPSGRVIGVDMTEQQLDVAKRNVDAFAKRLGWKPDLRFLQGYIENLLGTDLQVGSLDVHLLLLEEWVDCGVEKASVDIVISNCVVNLSPRKDLVLATVHDVLKPGGEFFFSDVYCDRRLPQQVREHKVLWGECIAGAMFVEDFEVLAKKVGFLDPRVVSKTEITVNDEFLPILGDAKFYSITYRLFKLPALDSGCEYRGQIATYLGTIPANASEYQLDGKHMFRVSTPVEVCDNTAAMLTQTWLRPYFDVQQGVSGSVPKADRKQPLVEVKTTGASCCAAPATASKSGCGPKGCC